MLNVEGLGRSLDPELDLWKTAKPYLERWMNEQIGVARLVRAAADGSAAVEQDAAAVAAPDSSRAGRAPRHCRVAGNDELMRRSSLEQKTTNRLLQALADVRLAVGAGAVIAQVLAHLRLRELNDMSDDPTFPGAPEFAGARSQFAGVLGRALRAAFHAVGPGGRADCVSGVRRRTCAVQRADSRLRQRVRSVAGSRKRAGRSGRSISRRAPSRRRVRNSAHHADVVEQADFFAYEPPFPVDWVYERAFLCALPPDAAGLCGAHGRRCCVPARCSAGFFFLGATPKGPPFGIERAALDALLSPHFELVEEHEVSGSIAVFAGRERWLTWRRRALRCFFALNCGQTRPHLGSPPACPDAPKIAGRKWFAAIIQGFASVDRLL